MSSSTTQSASYRTLVASDMAEVDQVIHRRLASEVVLVNQISHYIVNAGGKRVRPMLLLLIARALGCDSPQRHELAAVVEFIHTATLLHDDVVDESDLRRGRKTANALFGNAASVLVGDFLYSRAFQMMVSTNRLRVMDVLAEATNVIAEGEVLQLMNMHDPDISVDDYLKVIEYKTAKLFEAAGRVGAMLAAATPEQEAALAAYGMHLGTAFQIIDDVLDYTGDAATIGKSLGDDLAEGKPTLPLIYVMQHGTPEQSACVRKAIEEGGREDFSAVLEAIRSSGALAHARARAAQEAELARVAIESLGGSNYKTALLQLTLFAVERNH